MSFASWVQAIFTDLIVDLDTGYFTPKQIIVLFAFTFAVKVFLEFINAIFNIWGD